MMYGSIDPRVTRALLIMAVVTLPLKAWALWRSASYKQMPWFIILLLINSFGILELVYLFYFSKPNSKDPPTY